MIKITINGSKRAGEAPDPIEKLFERLSSTPLSPCFEKNGNFIYKPYHFTTNDKGKYVDDLRRPIYPDHPGSMSFFGNFYLVSAVFSVDTDEPELIARLTTAIRANQATPAYQQARKESL